jgi:hypothetical protein
VESKNWTLVRRCPGYRRFDTKGQLADLQQLETLLARRANILHPSMALLEKVRTGKHPSPWTKGLGGSKIQKRYHAPLTPLHRLLQAPEVSDQATARLLHQLKDEGPISLQRDIGILQAWLLGKTSKDTSLGAVSTHVRYEVLTEKTVVCNLSIRIEQFEEVRWGSGRLGKERTSVQRTCEPWETVFC